MKKLVFLVLALVLFLGLVGLATLPATSMAAGTSGTAQAGQMCKNLPGNGAFPLSGFPGVVQPQVAWNS